MNFIGIISDNKSFELIKNNFKNEGEQLIHINGRSIENIKNIKFEIIVINKELKNFKENISIIEELCMKAKYLIINTDIEVILKLEKSKKINIITFGLNHKATVTVSSITDSNILIYLQRNIKDKKGNIIEVGEKQVKNNKDNKMKIYENLIIYILSIINNYSII